MHDLLYDASVQGSRGIGIPAVQKSWDREYVQDQEVCKDRECPVGKILRIILDRLFESYSTEIYNNLLCSLKSCIIQGEVETVEYKQGIT